MEKLNEKETYYAVLMNRIVLDYGVYLYKPISTVEGIIEDYIDYKCFADNLGNSYNLSSDPSSLSCDDDLSVSYAIKEDDLLAKYPDVCLAEAVGNYYEEVMNKIHIGIYLKSKDEILFMVYDIMSILASLENGTLQPLNVFSNQQNIELDKEELDKILEATNGDSAIVIALENYKELLQIKDYNELHAQLQFIYDQVMETNKYLGLDVESCELIKYDEKAIFDLFDKSYTYILSINDVDEIKCTIQKVLDMYFELLNSEEYKDNLKCQDFLNDMMSRYFELLDYDNISEIKKGVLEIKKDEANNIVKIIEKSKEIIVTDVENVEKNHDLINVKEMKDYFDRKVIGQEEAKRDVISTIIMNSLSEDKRDKNGCLLIGPTGSGKTLIAQTASEYLDRPMQVFDTTQLTVPGYKGGDIEDFLVRLLSQTNGDIKKAENAIVVFDEIDKKGSDDHSDVSGKGVLDTLLSFIQGTTYDVKYNNRTILFDTSKLTIFATGAFTDVAEAKKITKKEMGFSAKIEEKEEDVTYPKLTIQDLVTIGKIPIELVGRFSTITQLKGHTKETLKEIILDCDNSVLLQEKAKLKKIGIDIKWTEGFIDAVVDKAFELKTGARSLKNILEASIKNVRWEALYNLGFYTTIVLTNDTVNDNEMCQLYDYKGNVYNLKDIIKEREEAKVKKLEKGN